MCYESVNAFEMLVQKVCRSKAGEKVGNEEKDGQQNELALQGTVFIKKNAQ